MLRGAQILDSLGDHRNSDRLITAAINSMKRIAWVYDDEDLLEIPARADVNAYMQKYPEYFGAPSPRLPNGSYSVVEAGHVTSAYQAALKNELTQDQIYGLSPSELNYWAARSKENPIDPNPASWEELHGRNLDRGSAEYDYYLQLIKIDPVYAQVPARELFEAFFNKYGKTPANDINRTKLNASILISLRELANNYLIQGDFDSENPFVRKLHYDNMQLDANNVTKLKMIQDILNRDNPKITSYTMNGLPFSKMNHILKQFDPEKDANINANELIVRAEFDKDADQKLNELHTKIAKFYRVTPDNYPKYYDLLQILGRNPEMFGASLKAIENIIGSGNVSSERDKAAIITVFNKNWEAWVAKFGGDIHAAAQILPPGSVRELSGLGDFLMRWFGKINNNDIHIISTYWSKLTPEQKQLPPKQIAEIANIAKVQQIFENEDVEHVPFAVETAKWWQDHKAVDESEWRDPDDDDTFGEEEAPRFDELQRLFMESQKVPLPEWTQYTASAGGLTGRFLPRSDVRGLYLGQYSNSCQHPWNLGAECAYHGQSSPHGAFFVVEDKEGNIVAQSWVWEDKDGDVVFDNVEALGIGKVRMPYVQKIYSDVAKQMEGRMVNIGAGTSDLDLKPFKASTVLIQPYDYDGYSDATKRQHVLADNT